MAQTLIRTLNRAIGVASIAAIAACHSPEDEQALVPPTADLDSNLPQMAVQVGGQSVILHLETHGEEGNPVLFVMHGSLADYRALRSVFQQLEDEYFVVFWDLRGNGLSQRIDRAEIKDELIVEEIDQIKQAFSPNDPVSIIGHSFGAMYASLYMSRRPNAVNQAVLMEPAGLNGQIFGDTFDDVFDLKLFDHEYNAQVWETEVFAPSGHEEMDYEALGLLHNGNMVNYHCDPDSPPEFPVWRVGAYFDYWRNKGLRSGGGFAFDYAQGLGGFSNEVLILGSECSALGFDFQQTHNAPLFGSAKVVGIPGTGHRMFIEDPIAVVTVVRDYLQP
jgi:proline iminopeptidase